jgi:hypothetical protein
MWLCPHCESQVDELLERCPTCQGAQPSGLTREVDASPTPQPLTSEATPRLRTDLLKDWDPIHIPAFCVGFIGVCVVRLLAAILTPGGIQAFLDGLAGELLGLLLCAGAVGGLAMAGWTGLKIAASMLRHGEDPPVLPPLVPLDQSRAAPLEHNTHSSTSIRPGSSNLSPEERDLGRSHAQRSGEAKSHNTDLPSPTNLHPGERP